jgi:hypothetical protein
MARDKFIANVRRAFSLAGPVIESDSPHANVNSIAVAVRNADLWLTAGAVEGFDPKDFPELDDASRHSLEAAVQGFRTIAERSSSDREQHRNQAWTFFQTIQAHLQPVIQREWLADVDRLLNDAADWCQQSGWQFKKLQKRLKDRFLGEYELRQLIFIVDTNQFLLDPIARFVSGGSGLVDLAVLPAYETVMIVKAGNRWYVHDEASGQPRREWSKQAFVDAVFALGKRA